MAVIERFDVEDEASFQTALLHVKSRLITAGFSSIEASRFLTAVSELARNILKYADKGWLEVNQVQRLNRKGIKVAAVDQGKGIEDIPLAMSDSYSSSGTLGQGLPGAKRLVDEFDIESSSQGTRVTIVSWC
ncbi:anti-sigma regulatory factor [Thalassotalea euphylliae]|uniref:anti-sigma regulatory factor n=1 Tax=Thalassotalea euphylliae TaxID=1655234 RepID=UPI003629F7E8